MTYRKIRKTAALLLFLLAFCNLSVQAIDPIDDGVYSLSVYDLAGFLGLGSAHGADPYIYYVTNSETVTADGYWKVTKASQGYTFQNESTGQWLVYTTGRVDQYYKYMTLSNSSSPEDNTFYWNIVQGSGDYFCIQSVAAPTYYWNYRSNGTNLMGTYAGGSRNWNEYIVFNKRDDGETELTAFPEALHVLLHDGTLQAFPLEIVKSRREADGQLVIETTFGQTYSYLLSNVVSVGEQVPVQFPTFESFKFNNKFNYQLFTDCEGTIQGDDIYLTVCAIGKRLTPSFKVSDERTVVYINGVQQHSKVSRPRFDKDIRYVLSLPGHTILLPDAKGSYTMQPYGRMVCVHVDWLTDRADVPRIDIVTSDGQPVTSKEEYKDATITIDGKGIFPSMATTAMQIRGRGNTSWNYSKKPYRLKFGSKVKPLGMTKGKNWVLLANAQSGSLMTNAIGMKAASLIGASAPNHIIPVDLYLNGEYKGNYNFTEKLGFSNNSVDITDETAAALFELDSYYDEAAGQKFRSMFYNLPINVKEPDFTEGTTVLTLERISNAFNRFLGDLYSGGDISRHVDIDQLARFMMVNELIQNFEFFHPKSTFCYRESFESDTSKIVFGPVWDLDWSFGYESKRNYFKVDATTNYWTEMPVKDVKAFIQDLRFKYAPLDETYKTIWNDFVQNDLTELREFCQDYYDFAHNSFASNKTVWNDNTDYAQQAVDAANWFTNRVADISADLANNVRPDIIVPDPTIAFDDTRLYTISCTNGTLTLNDAHNGLTSTSIRTNAPVEDTYFAIVTLDGHNYLYSPAIKKFLKFTGSISWQSAPSTDIVFDGSKPYGSYPYMITSMASNELYYFYLSTSSFSLSKSTSFNTSEYKSGNRWKLTPVGSFDPTEAIAVARQNLPTVTYDYVFNNRVVHSETLHLPSGSITPDPSYRSSAFADIKLNGSLPVNASSNMSYTCDVTWHGPFEFTTSLQDSHWYNMNVGGQYYVGRQDEEPYRPVSATIAQLVSPEYQWAFGGDPLHVRLYNRASALSQTLTLDGSNAVMRPADYAWDLLPNVEGFVLRAAGTANACLNQIGGSGAPLQLWTNDKSLTDSGSTFRVELPYILGDINGDRLVDNADADAFVGILISRTTTINAADTILRCDLNGDGRVSVADLILLVKLLQ